MPANTVLAPGYTATTVNLAAATTKYNLLELIQNASNGARANCGESFREVTIQLDPGNAVGTELDVGDGGLDATHRGYTLAVGESKTYSSDLNNVFPISLFLFVPGAQTNVKVNVELNRM